MYLEVLKQKERFHLRFSSLNHRETGMKNAFGSYKTNKRAVPGVFKC